MSLATDFAAAVDEVVFARSLGLEPDEWQAEALRSNHPRQLFNACRQSGKSTVASLRALHKAVYYPGSLILLLSPSLRQSGELFRKVTGFYSLMSETAPAEAESVLRLELKNGSRIVSLPGTEGTVRGFSGVDLLIFDEAARVSDDLYATTRPMLAVSHGSLIGLSTPYGQRGWWSEAWHSTDDWQRFEVPASECPRISPEWLEEEKRTIGPWWFNQEYNVLFVDAVTAAFASEYIDRLFSREVEPWNEL